ncbi:DNA-binding response regulator [Salinivibrio kushneri]|uniref:response regulator transcription factor n=1 Tax=Salinivibrio kushneri TaxID=1908198 RepID=UPI0009896C01|nr:response regulator transcription factor [Salinivibrio kushneri]OOE31942.1 DNA-binding response regulator [Salinivibrio kushneri]
MKKSILVVDDHPVVLLAAKMLLEQYNYKVIGEAKNGIDALKVIKRLSPDIVIIDLTIPSLDGMEVIQRCQSLKLKTRFLVYTSQTSEYFISLCMQAGASGYVSKDKGVEELLTAIRSLETGYNFFPEISTVSLSTEQEKEDESSLYILSSREMTVFKLLASGLSNKNIAEKMLLSDKTISTYKTRIFDKLNISNIAQLIDVAKRNSIL